MKRFRFSYLFFMVAIANADPVTTTDVDAAQAALIGRVSDAVDRYANEIGLSHDFVTYCNNELTLHTSLYPNNGMVPFGVNYNNIGDKETLTTVIYNREWYERSFLILCLANAKNTLRQAKRP